MGTVGGRVVRVKVKKRKHEESLEFLSEESCDEAFSVRSVVLR